MKKEEQSQEEKGNETKEALNAIYQALEKANKSGAFSISESVAVNAALVKLLKAFE